MFSNKCISNHVRFHFFLYIFIVILYVCAAIWNYYRLVPYVPVVRLVRGDHLLLYVNSPISKKHIDEICKVFDKYDVYYVRNNDIVKIRNYLFRDMDTLANYTNKAGYNEDDFRLQNPEVFLDDF